MRTVSNVPVSGTPTLLERSSFSSKTAAGENFAGLRRLMCFGVAVTFLLCGSTANAQIITVTTAFDDTDVPSSATIADLPGPDGVVSLREALRVSDNEPGRQTIGFAIPDDQRWLPNIYPQFVLLQGSFAFGASDPVTIDGTTQTAFGGDINPDGHEIVVELGVGMEGDGSELFGFHGTHVGLSGNNGVIHDNTGSMRISIGPFNSGCVVRDNEAGTIELTYSNDNVVIRNVTERVRITGYGPYGSPASGNVIGGPDPADRNYITGFGNYGEHGVPGGDCIELFDTDNTLIQNNYIGTTPDGMSISNSACTTGIKMMSTNDNVIVRDNLIAIQAFGIYPVSGVPFGEAMRVELYEGGSGIEVTGNTFGLNALGEPVLGSLNGIVVSRYAFEYGAQVRIGGPNPGEGNVIAGHLEAGVVMLNGTGIPPIGHIRLSGNSIYGNGEIGIDLMPNTWTFGPTLNDPLDADVGANGLQNYPDIFAATRSGQAIHVVGQLHSEPTSEYTLEFFASSECGPGGLGQAEVFLGATSAITDAAGNAPFDLTIPVAVPSGWMISSTATREPTGATSEFSDCVPIGGETFAGSFDVTHGTWVSGSLADLMTSDDSDLTASRNSVDLSSRVFIEVSGVSPTPAPSAFAFSLEGSVFARSEVVESIDFYNYISDSWEEVASSSASRFSDSTEIATASGDMTRFVQAGTNEVRARCRFESANARQQFAVNLDQILWMIGQ